MVTTALLAVVPVILIYLTRPLTSLHPLLTSSALSPVQLAFANDRLTGTRFWFLFVYFIATSVARRLRLIPHPRPQRLSVPEVVDQDGSDTVFRTPPAQSGTVTQSSPPSPSLSLCMPFHIIPIDFEIYDQCASLPTRVSTTTTDGPSSASRPQPHRSPQHLQLLLSALTEPAMLLLLARRGCPIDPMGCVNVRNRFEIPDLRRCAAALRRYTSGGVGEAESEGTTGEGNKHKHKHRHETDSRLFIHAALDEDVRRVKRGWEYSIVVELKDEQEVVFKQVFTMLQFHKHKLKLAPHSYSEQPSLQRSTTTTSSTKVKPLVDVPPSSLPSTAPTIASIKMASNDPQQWARLSKDYNPIHISSLAARLFGFRSKIAHGNHVVAKAFAGIDASNLARHDILEGANANVGAEVAWMEVEFRRPTFVPASLYVHVHVEDSGEGLEVKSDGKTNVVVRYGTYKER